MKKWIIVGIVFLGFLLHAVSLQQFPSGFTPDEASFGYDAYSIIHTGKDQWGQSLPIILKSFGDYKAPVYTYLDIPFVAILGLTKEAVRLPNAILGSLAIVVTYLLLKKVIGEKAGFFGALLLAISPWHIMMSRGAFEANLTTFFLALGIYLLFSKKLILAAIVLGINLFTYHSAKLITPIVVLIYFAIYRNEIIKLPKVKIIVSGVIFSFLLVVTFYTLLNGAATRVKDVSIFNGAVGEAFSDRQAAITGGENQYFAKLIHNKFTVDVKRFVQNYTTYFSLSYLFVHGPAEFTYGMIPGQGILYWFELPLLFFFIISFIRSKDRKFHYFILGWILVAPVTAALATGPGYAGNRSVIMIPAIQIATVIGLVEALKFFRNKYLISFYLLFAGVCVAAFLEIYFLVSPVVASKDMLYGNLEAAQWLSANVDKSTNVVFDKGLSEAHIYVAFANNWNPTEYQNGSKSWDFQSRGLNWVDQMPEYKLGNYTFKTVHPEEYVKVHGVILVGRPDQFKDGANIIKTIYYPDGKPAVLIVKM